MQLFCLFLLFLFDGVFVCIISVTYVSVSDCLCKIKFTPDSEHLPISCH